MNHFAGLVKECKNLIKDLNIWNPFDYEMTENEWKKNVKDSILDVNSKELKAEIAEKYKKLKK